MLHAAEGVGRAMAGSKAGWFHPQMVKDQGIQTYNVRNNSGFGIIYYIYIYI